MQTFLPYPSVVESARSLDRMRLGKQRLETKQILEILLMNGERLCEVCQGIGCSFCCGAGTKPSRWRNHPAVKMWEGYETALCEYGCIICEEWKSRGYKDSLHEFFKKWFIYLEEENNQLFNEPSWLGNEKFHASHRSNLLRKFPEHYGQFGWTEPNDLPYFWPTKEMKGAEIEKVIY